MSSEPIKGFKEINCECLDNFFPDFRYLISAEYIYFGVFFGKILSAASISSWLRPPVNFGQLLIIVRNRITYACTLFAFNRFEKSATNSCHVELKTFRNISLVGRKSGNSSFRVEFHGQFS